MTLMYSYVVMSHSFFLTLSKDGLFKAKHIRQCKSRGNTQCVSTVHAFSWN
jgi:hypothetical protein